MRIRRQAKRVGIFSQVITYSSEDLPEYVRSSPLFAFKRGGGYWAWKPYIIQKTLEICSEGDVVYYVDAGCALNRDSKEWDFFQEQMQTHNAIFFQYRSDYDYPGWMEFCKTKESCNPKVKYWTKPSVLAYFKDYFGDEQFMDYNKIWGGACIIKKHAGSHVLDEWYRLMLYEPGLFMDPYGADLEHLPLTFNCHRHDQSVITPLIFHYKERENILVIPETAESGKKTAAIVADRFRLGKMAFRDYLKYKIYTLVHHG